MGAGSRRGRVAGLFACMGLGLLPALVGCDHGTDARLPDDYQPVIGDVVYACGNWSGTRFVQDTTLLLDVHLAPIVWDAHDQPPHQSQIDSVTAHGGRIVHVFPYPAVRVRVQTADVPAMMHAAREALATAVPDSTQFDWRFIVYYQDAFTAADSLRLVELHGRVVTRFDWVPAVLVELPDASFVQVRDHARRVTDVEPESWGCLDSGSAPPYTRSKTIAAP